MKTISTTTTTTATMFSLTMRSTVLAAALVMGAAAGCEKKEPAKPNVPKPPAPDVTPKATSGGMSTTATPSSSAAGGATGVKSSPTTAPTAQASSPTTKPSGPVVDAPLVTSTENAKRSKEAQDQLDKAMKALKDGRFDDCKAALDKVDGMGGDVSDATREGAKTTRKSLEASQKLQKAPELPAGDGPNK